MRCVGVIENRGACRVPGAAAATILHARTHSVLVIVTQQIGDVLLTTLLIRAARERWPGARVDVLGFAGTLMPFARQSGDRRADRGDARTRLAPSLGAAETAVASLRPRAGDAVGDRAQIYGWVAARERSSLVPPAGSGRAWARHHEASAGRRTRSPRRAREADAALALGGAGHVERLADAAAAARRCPPSLRACAARRAWSCTCRRCGATSSGLSSTTAW